MLLPFLVEFWQGKGKQKILSLVAHWKEKLLQFHWRYQTRQLLKELEEEDSSDEEADEGNEVKITPRQARYLNRLVQQAQMPIYMVETEYVDKIQQMGHILLFGPVWPLISVVGFLKSLVAIRTDAVTMVLHHQRPLPIRCDSIGPWSTILRLLGWMSVALMPVWRSLLNPTPPISSEASAILPLLLSIFVAEKVYLLLVLFLRMILRRLPSRVDLQARRAAYELKQRLMKNE